MWTGRCEAWRWGAVSPPAAIEYDLQLAYPSIAAGCDVPHVLAGRVERPPAQLVRRALARGAVLAEVDVTTSEPVAPAAHAGGYHWPVGRFQTTVWDPELRLLLDSGQDVCVRRAWLYDRAPSLQPIARWLLTRLMDEPHLSTPVQLRALKHFARTVIGRCALRYRSWERFAQLPDFDLRGGELHDLETGERLETLHVGHEFLTLGAEVDADDALPQITGWVMSEARRRLWVLMARAGLESLLYVDTDSLIVTPAGARRLDAAIAAGEAWSLQRKATHRRLEILGPRQLLMGRHRRVAGVPLTATEVAPREFVGEQWRGLAESVARAEGGHVTIERRRWHLNAVDHRRVHLPDGSTEAHTVG